MKARHDRPGHWDKGLAAVCIALGLAASVTAWAWNPIDWTTIYVTTFYSDSTKIAIVGIEFAGECPYVPAPLVGEQTPYSDSRWILCKDVNQLDMPY
jgi:hypothetical protein